MINPMKKIQQKLTKTLLRICFTFFCLALNNPSYAQQPGDLVYVVSTNGAGVSFIPTSIEQPGKLGQPLFFQPIAGRITHDVSVGDFNNDGHPDFASCNRQGGSVDVFLRQQPLLPYQFSHTNFTIQGGIQLHAIESGDFNNDDFDDLVITDARGSVFIYKRDPANPGVTFTSFGRIYTVGAYPLHVVVTDFDQDGNLDFALANDGDGVPLFIFYGLGTGLFEYDEVPFVMPGGNPKYVILGDFNGDGLKDLAADSSGGIGNAHVVIFLNVNGNFLPGNALSIDLGIRGYISALTAGDFIRSGNQLPDLAVNVNNDLVLVETSNPPQPGDDPAFYFFPRVPVSWEGLLFGIDGVPAHFFPSDFSAADMNKDGGVDLVLSYIKEPGCGVFVMGGDGKGNLSFFSHAAMQNIDGQTAWHRLMFADAELADTTCDRVAFPQAFCNDNIPCTEDTCNRKKRLCEHIPHDESCSGLNNECRIGFCDVQLGCQSQPANEGQRCEQGSFCNAGAVCRDGQCVGTNPCDDEIECTVDLCNEGNDRCTHSPNALACPMDNGCLIVSCAPTNPNADPITGCTEQVRANGSECTTGDHCVYEKCQDGQCIVDFPIDCSRGNTNCKQYTCDQAVGCVTKFINEGGVCTLSDLPFDICFIDFVCQQGICAGNIPKDCDDGIACTQDGCETHNGQCFNSPVHSLCPGGDGQCVLSLCDPIRDCIIENLNNGAWCATGDFCMPEGHCQNLNCIPDKPQCDDGFDCTQDLCDPANQTCSVDTSMCLAECSDGIDNDGDGLIDFPSDPGCVGGWDDELSHEFACDDGIDNNGDGLPDRKDPRCQVSFDDDEQIKWVSELFPDLRYHHLALVNYDNDAEFEFVAIRSSSSDNSEVLIFDNNGNPLANFNVSDQDRHSYSIPKVSDIDKDGKDDIIFVEYDSSILQFYTFNVFIIKGSDKSLRRIMNRQRKGEYNKGGFAVGNINNAPNEEIIIVSEHAITVIDDAGNLLWENELSPGYTLQLPILANITPDNNLEIILLTSSGLKLYAHDGRILGEYNYTFRNRLNSIDGNSIAVGDMDNDKDIDITILDSIGILILKWEGIGENTQLNPYWEIFSEIRNDMLGTLSLGDLTGDGRLDMVISTRVNRKLLVEAFENSGNKLWEFQGPEIYFPINPTLVDIDGDQKSEIFLGMTNWPFNNNSRLIILDDNGEVIDIFQDRQIINSPQNTIHDYLTPLVGYVGNRERPGIIFSTGSINSSRNRYSNNLYMLDSIRVPDSIPYPLWRQIFHDAQNTSRAGACVENRDCYDGLIESNETCVNYTCQYTLGGTLFQRGDINADGRVDLTDPIFLLNALFLGRPQPPCGDAADADDSGRVNLTDAIYLLNHLFRGGQQPPGPYRQCGNDPTPDNLTCANFPQTSCP